MKKILFAFSLFIIVLASCNNSKNLDATSGNSTNQTIMLIKEAHIQKEVAGTEGTPDKTYVTLVFNEVPDENIRFQNLQTPAENVDIRKREVNEKTLRIELTKSIKGTNKAGNFDGGLFLRYTNGEQKYQEEIQNVSIKEPIYLP